jgi:hypothetical protein
MERNVDPVSVPYILEFLTQHPNLFTNLLQSTSRSVVVNADLIFSDEKKALAISPSALNLVLTKIPLKSLEPSVAPALPTFPPGYEPPNWKDEMMKLKPPTPVGAKSYLKCNGILLFFRLFGCGKGTFASKSWAVK